jgi:hypothetical protein
MAAPEREPGFYARLAMEMLTGSVFSSLDMFERGQPERMLISVFMPLGFMREQPPEWADDPPFLFYEHVGKANPMAVNGMPTFMSVQVIHMSERDKLIEAIGKAEAMVRGE